MICYTVSQAAEFVRIRGASKAMMMAAASDLEKAQTSEEDDRLSDLPDSVLAQILSFMGRYAVQTTVLSKRYKDLWRTTPYSLEFSSRSFQSLYSFDKFIRKFLSGRDQSVDVPSLVYYRRGRVEPRTLDKLVSYAVLHNAQHLKLTASTRTMALPSILWTSRSLKTLHIGSWPLDGSFVTIPTCLSLPNLTALYLGFAWFQATDDSGVCSFSLSGCTNLKVLVINYCNLHWLTRFHVNCPSQLEEFTFCGHTSYCQHKVVVTAPKLNFFRYSGALQMLPFSAGSLPPSKNVVVAGYVDKFYNTNLAIIAKDIINLLRGFHDAKVVTLCQSVFEVLAEAPGLEHLPPPFSNLKSLNLELRGACASDMLDRVKNFLLGSSPGATVVVA